MPEYAPKVGKGPRGAEGARAFTRPTSQSRLTSSSPDRRGVTAQQTLHGTLNQTPPVQAVAQLKRALNQSPGVAHVAQLATVLQEKPREFDTVQRAGVEDEELLQGRFETVQRAAEDEELLQGQFETAQRKSVGAQPEAAQNRTGMPDHLKAGIESLSGMDISDVRVHTNSDRPAQLDALAYAQGSDIHVAPGQERHLPHEAWHVVQQRQGRVVPTMQMQGVSINDDRGLEAEADAMGARASQLKLDTALDRSSK